jgi:hypothetical protein
MRPTPSRSRAPRPAPTAATARRRPAGAPWPELPRAVPVAVWALATAALLGVALLDHPVGDYFTESDFYGGYAIGARLIQRGVIDPSRYVVVGPVYDLLLALAGTVVRDLFTAARLIAVAAASVTLALWGSLARRWLGGAAAVALVALLALDPHFARYGISVTTDLPAIAFQSAALWLVWSAAGPLGLVGAGLCAAAATLTRYSAVALVPAALLSLAWLAPRPRPTRARAVALFLAGFVLPVAAWTAWSFGHGVMPGGMLVRNAVFYADTSSASRNRQDVAGGLDAPPPAGATAPSGSAFAPGRIAAAALDHARRDATETLVWPVAALALAGLALLALERRVRPLAPALVFAACQWVVLVPVFHTPRYALACVPPLLVLAAAVPAAPWRAAGGRAWRVALAALALVPLVFAGRETVRLQRFLRTQLPVEVLEVGRALRAVAPPGARVMTRKGQIAYEAGLTPVPFPRVDSLPALAAEARRARADFLYYSWYEVELRPELAFLLDTTGVVPGLTVVHATEHNPAVAYRIGPGFGRAPDWFADRQQRALHIARAQVVTLPDADAWQAHFFLAGWEARHGRLDLAVTHLETVLRVRPDLTTARRALEQVRRAQAAARAGAAR